jgi:hypothetical protein
MQSHDITKIGSRNNFSPTATIEKEQDMIFFY